MFTKKHNYFYDSDAIKEPAKYAGDNRGARTDNRRGTECNFMSGVTGSTRNMRSVWHIEDNTALVRWLSEKHPEVLEGFLKDQISTNVWTANVKPFKGTHFATFPEALVSPMILAGTSEKGVCPECGAPWKRQKGSTEWERTCECAEQVSVPATVLDPFCGAGTTGLVCMKNDRKFTGIELNPEYAEIASERIKSGILPYVKLFKMP